MGPKVHESHERVGHSPGIGVNWGGRLVGWQQDIQWGGQLVVKQQQFVTEGAPTWVADEHGVVLRAAAEDAHNAADLLVAPDDGVQLRRLGGQVSAVLLQRLELLVGHVAVHICPLAHLLQRRLQLRAARACTCAQ